MGAGNPLPWPGLVKPHRRSRDVATLRALPPIPPLAARARRSVWAFRSVSAEDPTLSQEALSEAAWQGASAGAQPSAALILLEGLRAANDQRVVPPMQRRRGLSGATVVRMESHLGVLL